MTDPLKPVATFRIQVPTLGILAPETSVGDHQVKVWCGDQEISGAINDVSITVKRDEFAQLTLTTDRFELETGNIEGVLKIDDQAMVEELRRRGYKVEIDDTDLKTELSAGEQDQGVPSKWGVTNQTGPAAPTSFQRATEKGPITCPSTKKPCEHPTCTGYPCEEQVTQRLKTAFEKGLRAKVPGLVQTCSFCQTSGDELFNKVRTGCVFTNCPLGMNTP